MAGAPALPAGLEVGVKLHAQYTDGEFYKAEVVAVSSAKKHARAPVQVRFAGFAGESDTWMPLTSLKSKKLGLPPKAPEPDLSALVPGTLVQVLSEGKYYKAEVLAVKSGRRSPAPVKVHFVGYAASGDEWVAVDRIRSKLLRPRAADGKAEVAGDVADEGDSKATPAKDGSKADKQAVDELVSAGWVIPVEQEGALRDHTVVIHGGKILDILPTAEAVKKYRGKKQTRLPNAALMPGLINAHTHTPMVYLRGVSDDIPLRDWLESTIWPLEFKFCGPDFVREGAELAIAEMILGGVTTFNDMYWFPEAVCEAVVRSGIRAAVGMIALEFPFGAYGNGPDEYLDKGQKVREKYAGESLLSWTVSLHAPYTCSDETLKKGGALSEKLGLPLHIHLHETSVECEDSSAGNKSPSCHMSEERCTPVANLKRLGLLNERLVAVHMNWLTDEEISWCADGKISVVHCPASGLKLASGFCRVADLMKAGVNVCIGTDGASSNNTLDVLAEMRLAAILAKAVAKDARAVPATAALRMATLSGAKALGLDSVTGSLVVGKDADMVAIRFGSPGTWPAPTVPTGDPGFDPVTHIVYSSTRDQVSDVWVRGRRLMERRKVLTLNVRDVQKAAEKWGAKITEALKEMHSKKDPQDVAPESAAALAELQAKKEEIVQPS